MLNSKNYTLSLFLIITSTIAINSASAAPATVVLLKGNAFQKPLGSASQKTIQNGDKIPEGSLVSTKEKSFVRLLLSDQSQINVGPNSSMVIEKTKNSEPGMIELIDGKIRAKITKDLLKDNSDENKNKLIIRTKVAAMGVRGTDFQVNYAKENKSVSLITFESSVAMVKLDQPLSARAPTQENISKLNDSLSSSKAVLVGEGQFSSASQKQDASPAVRISTEQIESLKKNETLIAPPGRDVAQTQEKYISPIPPGVDSKNFVSSSKIEKSIEAVLGSKNAEQIIRDVKTSIEKNRPEQSSSKVLEGGYVDISRNIYVAPDPSKGAIFDATLNMYIPDPSIRIGNGGELKLAEGIHITESGSILRLEPGAKPPTGTELRGPASEILAPPPQHEDSLNDQDEEDDDTDDDDDSTITNPSTTDVLFNISA